MRKQGEQQVHQVCGSYICALIDVIILPLNKRLWDEFTVEQGGDVLGNTEAHESSALICHRYRT